MPYNFLHGIPAEGHQLLEDTMFKIEVAWSRLNAELLTEILMPIGKASGETVAKACEDLAENSAIFAQTLRKYLAE
jgi:hypothetical protein